MASIQKEILTKARPQDAWTAIRDIGALHQRLVPGFVVDTRLEPGARIVTFGNGMLVKELIVDLDDKARRLVWAVVEGQLTHHNASVQVFAHGDNESRVVWIADLLPDELADAIGEVMEQGTSIMKKTLDHLTYRDQLLMLPGSWNAAALAKIRAQSKVLDEWAG